MITLSYTADRYCIRHTAHRGTHTCLIAPSMLPENARKILDSLLIHGLTHDHTFALSERQDHEAAHIFHKLRHEQGSGYVFSEQLKKTYLLELIHFLTKLHLQAYPFSKAGAN